jgi:hypothetical protein
MSKTKISQYDTNPANNTDIEGINLAEGMAPGLVNNAIRELMAQLKEFQTGASGDSLTVGGNLVVTGTGTLSGRAIDAFPSGTKMLFQQTSAPVGWTKDTTNDDKALRIVSGSVGSGGTLSLTSFASQSIGGTSLTTAQIPSHNHTGSGTTSTVSNDHTHGFSGTTSGVGDHQHGVIVDADSGAGAGPHFKADGQAVTTNFTNGAGAHSHTYSGNTGGISANHTHDYSFTTAATGSGNSHTHTLDLDIAYVDVIVATKN